MHRYAALHINFSTVSIANVSLDGTVYWSKICKEVCECRKGYRSVWKTRLVSVFAISFRTPSGAEITALFWTTSGAIKPNTICLWWHFCEMRLLWFCMFCNFFKVKCSVSGAKSVFIFKMKVNLAKFSYTGCCTYRGSSEIKCCASGAKRLMLYCVWKIKKHTTYANPTLNLTIVLTIANKA